MITSAGIQLRNLLLSSFDKRFGNIEYMTLLAISTILDPRFKILHFHNPLAHSQAIQKIVTEMQLISKELYSKRKRRLPKRSNDDNVWSHHETLLTSQHQTVHEEEIYSRSEMLRDLKHYLNQPPITLNDDPLNYWHKNNVYPILNKIAHRYFPIVATSVPSERLFSKAGNILIENRNRISPTHL